MATVTEVFPQVVTVAESPDIFCRYTDGSDTVNVCGIHLLSK